MTRTWTIAAIAALGCAAQPTVDEAALHALGSCDDASWDAAPGSSPLAPTTMCEVPCEMQVAAELGSCAEAVLFDHATGQLGTATIACPQTFDYAGVAGCCGEIGDDGMVTQILFAQCE